MFKRVLIVAGAILAVYFLLGLYAYARPVSAVYQFEEDGPMFYRCLDRLCRKSAAVGV